MQTPPIRSIMQMPNVLGCVQCAESGDILAQEGSEVDALPGVLMYFQQVAGLIGESLGHEGFQEAQIQNRTLTVVCLPHGGGAVGVVLNSRARMNETVAAIRQSLAAA